MTDLDSAYERFSAEQSSRFNRLFALSQRETMNEYEMLLKVVADAIFDARLNGNDATEAAEKAAQAFKAGLAAFAGPSPSSESKPKGRAKASPSKPRR